ncbi:hypothetical protein HC028_00880 [Planosporangium flavigriseum]|uniref:Uncharacterized protein n=1 Tax=Planosporangium flavigriseum TaxID=373681 RepID=A0A8J3PMM0_9ACTN|nr:hypothetical protein [Planosporangium flavigriseum]NJC63077.1 hypothetical protein [Planosporangium flavigriseum]GIG74449.1 hypothetical protein Pfl04_28530 [Planosporangium flavigriseum]
MMRGNAQSQPVQTAVVNKGCRMLAPGLLITEAPMGESKAAWRRSKCSLPVAG